MPHRRSRSAFAAIHGLLGCSEWTGVKLSTLLDEAGVEPAARWVIAEGADAAGMSRSVFPMEVKSVIELPSLFVLQ